MQLFDTLAFYLLSLNRKKTQLVITSLVILLAGIIGSITYGLIQWRHNQIASLKELYRLADQTEEIVQKYEKVRVEEERIKGLLQENEAFNIKRYFEQLCQQERITPQLGWDTHTNPLEGSDTFEEVVLEADFVNITMKTLVTLLNQIEQHQLIYIRELEIRKSGNHSLECSITIATQKYKSFWND